MKKLMRRAAALTAAGAMVVATTAVTTGTAQAAGIVLTVDNAIDGRYIVVLNDADAYTTNSAVAAAYGGKLRRDFPTINGFSAELSAQGAAALAADPAVEYVQQDGVVSSAGTQDTPPSWGLDRIDERDLPLDDSYTYPDSAGAGVTAYVIDTGADIDHPDFGGRMSSGVDMVDGDMVAEDCNGHGTHVAGTVGGTEYGVAKQVDLVAVRVLNCDALGTVEDIIDGIEWVTQNATLPAVANMSLGAGGSEAINDAVEASVAAGVTYAVSAGNDYGYDACNLSPASAPSAITVGSTNAVDSRSGLSNIGTCVDIFAPGVNIASAWLDGGARTASGTSMASPHVAGAAALHLGEYPTATPAQVKAELVSNATANVVDDAGPGSPNLLLHTGYLNDPDEGEGPGGFSLILFPSSGSLTPGDPVTASVAAARTSGDHQTVTFRMSGVPKGVTASISPSTISTDNGVASFTMSSIADANVMPGTYTIEITAYGSETHTVEYTLTVTR